MNGSSANTASADSAFLRRFSEAANVRELSEAATGLIRTKEVHAVQASDRFYAGLARLRSLALSDEDRRSRMEAIAILQRIRAVLKKRAAPIEAILREALATEPPSVQLLDDAEARYYVASALGLASGDWVLGYAARELCLESLSDNTARALASALLRAAGNVEKGLVALQAHASRITGNATKTADVAARRLKRILSALRQVVRSESLNAGQAVARQLRAFLLVPIEGGDKPEDPKAVREFIEAVGGLIDDLIRCQLSLVVDSELYLVLTVCRRWCPTHMWGTIVSRSAVLKALSRTLSEGIRVSSKQGVTDQGLFDALELVLGSKEKALQITRRLADESPGSPEGVQRWLREGRITGERADSVYATQHELLQSDQYVATALLESVQLQGQHSGSDPYRGLVVAVRSLAAARNLSTFGTEGEVVFYSPHLHAVVSGIADTSKVRIVRPGVERTDLVGSRQVVVKAVVESVK